MKACLVIFSLLADIIQPKQASANGNDEMATAAQTLCDEKAYLTGLRQHLTSAAAEKNQATRSAETLAAKWKLVAATAAEHDEKCLFLALASQAAAMASGNAIVAAEASRATLAATAAISEQIGMIEAAELFAKTTFDGSQSTHGGTAATTRSFNLQTASAGQPLCSTPEDASKIANRNVQPQYNKLHTIKTTSGTKMLSFIKAAKTTITGLTSCDHTGGENQAYSAAMASCNYNSAGEVTTTLERDTATVYSGEDRQLFQQNDRRGKCTETKVTDKQDKDRTKDLSHLLCTALQASDKATADPTNIDGNTLAADSSTLNIIRNCNPRFQHIADIAGSGADALKKYVKTAYGEDNTKFTDKFIRRLSQIKPTVRKDKTSDATKSVEELAGNVDAAAAAAHAEGERIKREIEAGKMSATIATVDSKKAEECKGETDETKCNKKDGCEFKDGECKTRVTETEAGKTGTQNTTESNSFVIHKAPPLLAFFSYFIFKIFFLNFMKFMKFYILRELTKI
uniref:Variant surface glycoprotein 1125.463 n=1 Tax=Trypanosoma brucei TaxID=5691 RepID=A0A1J0R5W8_9TRYP|nr:variant surface glycoprotein 1125.463 [Trypanosoma brucei]